MTCSAFLPTCKSSNILPSSLRCSLNKTILSPHLRHSPIIAILWSNCLLSNKYQQLNTLVVPLQALQ